MLRLGRFVSYRFSAPVLPPLQAACREIHVSLPLCGEPLKKKKKLDPAIIKMQTDRRRRRLEKQIKVQSRFARKLKPVDDFELDRELEKNSRPRNIEPLTDEEEARRHDLILEWLVFKRKQRLDTIKHFSDMIKAQELALSELKLVSPEKYEMAVKKDEDLLPISFTGVCETPPIPGYVQDGRYTETTNSYELDPEIVKLMLDKNEKLKHAKKKRRR